MTDREKEQLSKPSVQEYILWIILLIFLLSSLASCKTQRIEVPVEVPITHTEYVNKTDSFYLHDSIYLERYTANDTVFLNKYVYRDKFHTKTDTLVRLDSISVPVYITKTVEVNHLYWFQKAFIFLGIASFIGFVLWIIKKFR